MIIPIKPDGIFSGSHCQVGLRRNGQWMTMVICHHENLVLVLYKPQTWDLFLSMYCMMWKHAKSTAMLLILIGNDIKMIGMFKKNIVCKRWKMISGVLSFTGPAGQAGPRKKSRVLGYPPWEVPQTEPTKQKVNQNPCSISFNYCI